MTGGELVKFPTRRYVLERLGLDFDDRQAAIDAEIRRVDNTIRVLKEKRAALLVEYRKEIRRTWRALGDYIVG
jgi:hypothetical protein